ncbi:MAG: hypothetical protein ACRDG2_11500 [Actinomycetota bacterium]
MTMQPQHTEDTDSEDVAESRPMPAPPETEETPGEESDRLDSSSEGSHEIDERRPLFDDDELGTYRSRWDEVQARFVDDPRGTVKDADALVNDVMERLTQTFTDERSSLESRWSEGKDASTEDLRVAMQRYRSFFARLLAA